MAAAQCHIDPKIPLNGARSQFPSGNHGVDVLLSLLVLPFEVLPESLPVKEGFKDDVARLELCREVLARAHRKE